MNKIVHFEISADDPLRAIEFYTKVFGWRIEKLPLPFDYWLIEMGDDTLGGAIKNREQPTTDDFPNAFVCIINVVSIDEITEKILSSGGKIIIPKRMIPTIGWNAYCKDTEGNQFGLIQYL